MAGLANIELLEVTMPTAICPSLSDTCKREIEAAWDKDMVPLWQRERARCAWEEWDRTGKEEENSMTPQEISEYAKLAARREKRGERKGSVKSPKRILPDAIRDLKSLCTCGKAIYHQSFYGGDLSYIDHAAGCRYQLSRDLWCLLDDFNSTVKELDYGDGVLYKYDEVPVADDKNWNRRQVRKDSRFALYRCLKLYIGSKAVYLTPFRKKYSRAAPLTESDLAELAAAPYRDCVIGQKHAKGYGWVNNFTPTLFYASSHTKFSKSGYAYHNFSLKWKLELLRFNRSFSQSIFWDGSFSVEDYERASSGSSERVAAWIEEAWTLPSWEAVKANWTEFRWKESNHRRKELDDIPRLPEVDPFVVPESCTSKFNSFLVDQTRADLPMAYKTIAETAKEVYLAPHLTMQKELESISPENRRNLPSIMRQLPELNRYALAVEAAHRAEEVLSKRIDWLIDNFDDLSACIGSDGYIQVDMAGPEDRDG